MIDVKAELRASFERQGWKAPAQPYRKAKRLYVRPTIETAAKICDTCGKPMNGSGYIGVRHPWCTHRIFERKRLARQRRNYARRKLNYDEAA